MSLRHGSATNDSRSSWQERFLEKYYGHSSWVDGTTEFHDLCARFTPRGGRILEIGAGPDNATSRFLAGLGELHGVDIDSAVLSNTALSSAAQIDGDRYPFDSSSFDVCVSNYVLEHVEQPAAHLSEVHRILKRDGLYIFRTPNRYHYTAIVSRWTPHWVHLKIANALRDLPAESHDPYPTFYRVNSVARLRQLARMTGFDAMELRLVEKEPSYGMRSRGLFLTFMAYERIVNASEALASLRANIFGVLRKVEA